MLHSVRVCDFSLQKVVVQLVLLILVDFFFCLVRVAIAFNSLLAVWGLSTP